MADQTPTGINVGTLGTISSGLGSYSGNTTTSRISSSSGRSSQMESLNLDDFIETDIEDYESEEIENIVVTNEDIIELVGTMSPEDYLLFIDGMKDYIDEQISIYDTTIEELKQQKAEMFEYMKWHGSPDIILKDHEDKIYELIDKYEYLARRKGDPGVAELGVTAYAFLDLDYTTKKRLIIQNCPEMQDIIYDICIQEDPEIVEKFGYLGIYSYQDLMDFYYQLDPTIESLTDLRNNMEHQKESAIYDYLPFLEDFQNYTPPTTDYHELYSLQDGDTDYDAFVTVLEAYPQIAKTYYYLKDQNPALAAQYFKDIKYELNQLEGQALAEQFLRNLGEADGSWDTLEAIANELGVSLYGLCDGLETFGEGLCYTVEALMVGLGIIEENREMTAEQYKRMYILQALLSEDAKIAGGLIYEDEDWNLHNTDPNSIIDYTRNFAGPYLRNNYELSQGIGNMLPSIIASIYCPVAGQWLMGLSAGGNAYHSAMVEGQDYFVALLYAAFTGVSEPLFEKMLGGLPFLSDVQVTSFSTYLMAMGNEATEEVFQSIMDKMFRCVAMGEKLPETPEEWEEWGKDLLKDGAYGAITAGILHAPNLVAALKAKRQAKLASINSEEQIDIREQPETKPNDAVEELTEVNETEPTDISNEDTNVKTLDETITNDTSHSQEELITIAEDILNPNSPTGFEAVSNLTDGELRQVMDCMTPEEMARCLPSMDSETTARVQKLMGVEETARFIGQLGEDLTKGNMDPKDITKLSDSLKTELKNRSDLTGYDGADRQRIEWYEQDGITHDLAEVAEENYKAHSEDFTSEEDYYADLNEVEAQSENIKWYQDPDTGEWKAEPYERIPDGDPGITDSVTEERMAEWGREVDAFTHDGETTVHAGNNNTKGFERFVLGQGDDYGTLGYSHLPLDDGSGVNPDADGWQFVSLGDGDGSGMLTASGGTDTVRKFEEDLGIPTPENPSDRLIMVTYDVDRDGVEMPTGREIGSNNQRLPGGRTPNGETEAVHQTIHITPEEAQNIRVEIVPNNGSDLIWSGTLAELKEIQQNNPAKFAEIMGY